LSALKTWWPELPFMDRMGLVFLLALVLAIGLSFASPIASHANRIQMSEVRFRTSTAFNVGAGGVMVILVALYTAWW
jgi:solute:Na+ symporter, SSS family